MEKATAIHPTTLRLPTPFIFMVIYFLDVMCGELADIDAIDRNQRQAQGVEPAQSTQRTSTVPSTMIR
jgi:hypothetical protein